MSVDHRQRFTRTNSCPICHGYTELPQGRGVRCWGFIGSDGRYAHCTNESHAGGLEKQKDGTFWHRLAGSCGCGQEHGPTRADSNGAHADAAHPWREVERWATRDVDGTVLCYHVRSERPDGGKRFRWEMPDGRTGLDNCLHPVDLLYGLEKLAQHPDAGVVLTEGEKAADALQAVLKLDQVVVLATVCGAASTLSATALAHLAGRRVALWSDNDAGGRDHMVRNGDGLQRGAESVRWVHWADAPPKGDAADYCADHTRKDVHRLLRESQPFKTDRGAEGSTADASAAHKEPKTVPTFKRASEITPRKVQWLQRGRLALGKVTLLYSNPGDGKSLIAIDWTARATTGRGWQLGQPNENGPVDVMILSAEDDPDDTIVPRLIAAGADRTRVHIHMLGEKDDGLSIPEDVPQIEGAAVRLGARLIVIDTLYDYLGLQHDSHRTQDVRQGLRPLVEMARRTGICVLVITHPNKTVTAPAIYRAAGSLAVVAYARLSFVIGHDRDDPDLRILAPVKQNITRAAPSLAYRINEWVEDPEVGVVEWDTEVAATADEVMEPPQKEGVKPKVEEAASYMVGVVNGGRVLAGPFIEHVCKELHITERWVRTARDRAHIQSKRVGFGPGARVWWIAPEDGPYRNDKSIPVEETLSTGKGLPFRYGPETLRDGRPLMHLAEVEARGVYRLVDVVGDHPTGAGLFTDREKAAAWCQEHGLALKEETPG